MSLQELLSAGGDGETGIGLAIAVFVIMSLIQISPLEVNPWSYLGNIALIPFKMIGRAMTCEIAEQIKRMSGEIAELRTEVDRFKQDAEDTRMKNEVDRIIHKRSNIIRFGDEIRAHTNHSLEHFNSILEAIDEYENYCATHPLFENGKAVTTIKIIKADFEERLRNNDFL